MTQSSTRKSMLTTSPVESEDSPIGRRSAAHSNELGLERMIFFSDAVFAIAITLLSLDLRLPGDVANLGDKQLFEQLLLLGDTYLSYLISFLVIGSFWLAHHRKFQVITRYDNGLLLLNLLQLLVIAFVPFPTVVLSENGNRTATIFYALTMTVVGLFSAITWWYATYNNRLVPDDFTAVERNRGFVQNLIVPIVFLLSIGVAFFDSSAAKYVWFLLIVVARLV